jgi:hypothetical protein
VDFDDQKGIFKANDEYLNTTLPYNQYITSMNEFTWDMQGEYIDFEAKLDKPGIFTSIHPDQDSLQFEGQTAHYDLKSSLLKVGGVPFIVTADAMVYPDSQYVEIAPNASMSRLENARIVADTFNRYHVINRATVDILGRRSYKASGFYEYNIADKEQEIELQDIVGQPVGKGSLAEKRAVTRATGQVSAKDTFYIDHKTRFQGKINLNAESRNLQFDGFARLEAENLPHKYWFTVSSEGDKKDLAIRFDSPLSYEGAPLETGLFLSKEFARVYPRALMPTYFRKDRPILPVKGVFKYDETKDEFIFGDSSKVIRNDLKGNVFVFKNKDGSAYAEGKFQLGSGLKYVKIDAAGFAEAQFPPPPPEPIAKDIEVEADSAAVEEETAEDELIMLADDPLLEPEVVQPDSAAAAPAQQPVDFPVTAEYMAGITFPLPDPLMKIIQNDFKSATFDSKGVTYLTDIDFYRKSMSELFPEGKELRDAMDGLSLGFLDIPKKLNTFTLLFSRLKTKWNQDYQSFVTMENDLGLVSIGGEPVNKMVEAYVEIKMPQAEDDRLYVYLKSPSGLYYFFGYNAGILNVTSNNTVFMEEFGKLKSKDLVIKQEDGENLEIQVVETGTAQTFMNRVKAGRK